MRIVRTAGLSVVALAVLLSGCTSIPRDSAGSLNRIRLGELRAGAAHAPPWVVVADDGVRGLEAELIAAWAAELDARVRWESAGEAELVERLRRRELDVVIAGFEGGSPFAAQVAFTQPYLEAEDRYGSTRKRVLAVMPGESALLFSLDRFLASQDVVSLRRRVDQDSARPGPPR